MGYLSTDKLSNLVVKFKKFTGNKQSLLINHWDQPKLEKVKENCNSWATFYLEKAKELRNFKAFPNLPLLDDITDIKNQYYFLKFKEMKTKAKTIEDFITNLKY